MATILEAVRNGVLEPFEIPDWERRLPERMLWLTPALWDQIDNEPRAHIASAKLGGRTPYEHMDSMFTDFRCGERALGHSEIKRMNPTSSGVWEMHPPGLRVFGWCPEPHAFVAVSLAIVEDLKADSKLYDKHRDGVIAFAKAQGLSSTLTLGDYRALFPQNN